jgi:hypothetical protein
MKKKHASTKKSNRKPALAGTVGSASGRIVLATGYPWALGTGPYQSVQMHTTAMIGKAKNLRWPKKLWKDNVAQYRLVLELLPNSFGEPTPDTTSAKQDLR